MLVWYLPVILFLIAIGLLVALYRPLRPTIAQFAGVAELLLIAVTLLTAIAIGRPLPEAVVYAAVVGCFGFAALTGILTDLQSPARATRGLTGELARAVVPLLQQEVVPTGNQSGEGIKREDGFGVLDGPPCRAWRLARRRLVFPGIAAIAGAPPVLLFNQQVNALTLALLVLAIVGAALLLVQRSAPAVGVVSLEDEISLAQVVEAWSPTFVTLDGFAHLGHYRSKNGTWVLLSSKSTEQSRQAVLVTGATAMEGDGLAMTRSEWLRILALGRFGLSRRLRLQGQGGSSEAVG